MKISSKNLPSVCWMHECHVSWWQFVIYSKDTSSTISGYSISDSLYSNLWLFHILYMFRHIHVLMEQFAYQSPCTWGWYHNHAYSSLWTVSEEDKQLNVEKTSTHTVQYTLIFESSIYCTTNRQHTQGTAIGHVRLCLDWVSGHS